MRFEDEIRGTMRAHDPDAPPADDLTLPSMRTRRLTWLPPAAAALIVIAIAGTWFAIDRNTGSSNERGPAHRAAGSAAQCPASYDRQPGDLWVPHDPEGVPDGADRLAPEQTPTSAVICAYLHGDSRLTGQQELTGALKEIPKTLSLLPRSSGGGSPCTFDLQATDGDDYLIGLTYADGGLVWVAAPGNHCAGASNGVFDTPTNLLDFVGPSYRQGVWTGPPAEDPRIPCGGPELGRLGSELVPGTPVSVSICASSGEAPPRTGTTTDIADLVAALNALPTQPSTMSCNGGPSATSTSTSGPTKTVTTYTLVFHYAAGPAVRLVLIPGCNPPIFTSSLAAENDGGIVNLVEQLLG